MGEDNPIVSRIICLDEHLDEIHMRGLTGDAYAKNAIRVAKDGAGGKFDKKVVNAFLSTYQ